MSPSAADVPAIKAKDPLAALAPPSAKRATAGFQEHLQRADQAQALLKGVRESTPRSTRDDSSRTEEATERERSPRGEAARATGAAKARRPSTPEADASRATAVTDERATTDEEAPTDAVSNAAAEQAAGQAGAAEASTPPEETAPEETVAVVEVDPTAELAEGALPVLPTTETEQPTVPEEAAQAAAETVESPESLTPKDETPTSATVASQLSDENGATGAQAEKGSAPGTATLVDGSTEPAAAAAPTTAKPQVSAEADDEKTDSQEEETETSAVGEAKPVGSAGEAGASAVAAVATDAGRKDDGPRDEKQKPDDKIGDISGRSNDGKPAGPDVSRIDGPVRPQTATDQTTRTSAAAGGEGTTNLSQAERTRLVQRVAKAVQTAHDRGGELKLRLSPPELGSLKLEVKLHDGVLSARIETETHDAQRVLNENLLVLRERLAEQNIKVERFDVDVFNPGAGGGGNAADLPQQSGDGRGESGGRNGSTPREGVARGETRIAEVRRTAVSADGRINVVV